MQYAVPYPTMGGNTIYYLRKSGGTSGTAARNCIILAVSRSGRRDECGIVNPADSHGNKKLCSSGCICSLGRDIGINSNQWRIWNVLSLFLTVYCCVFIYQYQAAEIEGCKELTNKPKIPIADLSKRHSRRGEKKYRLDNKFME